jgi:hypothetical protein
MAGIGDGIIAGIGAGIVIAGTAAIGDGESLKTKQARVAGLFFVRAAGMRC